jgi:glycerophosphoryl diester phosphodiesterase
MSADWLTTLPIAHRGLHDGGQRLENSRSAARAAVKAGYAIECDVQLTADGQAVVFHDFTLERLTNGSGKVFEKSLKELNQFLLKNAEPIPTFEQFLLEIDGRTPIFCEIKSHFDSDLRLAQEVARHAASYPGSLALESFDPVIMTYLRREASALGISHVPRGMVAQAKYDRPGDEWSHLSTAEKDRLATFAQAPETQPQFLSWSLRDWPHPTPATFLASGGPVTFWTVRSPGEAALVKAAGGQIVFEGFSPDLS